jgi:hypothetical protein
MSYYRPQPLLPTRSPSHYIPKPQPIRYPVAGTATRGPTNWCTMFIRMLEQNPRLMQVLRRRPDMLQMFRNRCGGFAIGADVTRRYYKPRRRYPYGNTLPPYPQPQPPQTGCGYGKRFDSCGCRCVPKDAITPQCIRNCTECAVGQVFNWCIMRCVDANAKIRQCPPLQ